MFSSCYIYYRFHSLQEINVIEFFLEARTFLLFWFRMYDFIVTFLFSPHFFTLEFRFHNLVSNFPEIFFSQNINNFFKISLIINEYILFHFLPHLFVSLFVIFICKWWLSPHKYPFCCFYVFLEWNHWFRLCKIQLHYLTLLCSFYRDVVAI